MPPIEIHLNGLGHGNETTMETWLDRISEALTGTPYKDSVEVFLGSRNVRILRKDELGQYLRRGHIALRGDDLQLLLQIRAALVAHLTASAPNKKNVTPVRMFFMGRQLAVDNELE